MPEFLFEGTTTIERKFKIKINANNYEDAQEQALNLLNDVEDTEYYKMDEDEVDIEIDEYEVSQPLHARGRHVEYEEYLTSA